MKNGVILPALSDIFCEVISDKVWDVYTYISKVSGNCLDIN